MNSGPVFVNVLLVVAIYGGAAGFLSLFYGMDEELKICGRNRLVKRWLIYGALVCIPLIMGNDVTSPAPWMSIWILGVYLVTASVTDTLIYQVYDVLQYMGVIGGGVWLTHRDIQGNQGIALMLFAIIQYGIFMCMYGKADGMGYCVCSLYLAGKGLGLDGFLYQMLAGFLILTLVQLLRRNISIKGQLKQPIALYPYIVGGFMILWYSK